MVATLALCVSLVATTLSGCTQTEDERCTELNSITDAKATALPRACESDLNCLVVTIHPAYYAAANTVPSDPELDVVVAEHAQSCDISDPIPNVFEARCVTQDVTPDPNQLAPGVCTLFYGTLPVDFSDPDSLLDVDFCECSNLNQCGEGELCMDDCVCKPECEAACGTVNQCGEDALKTAGMGTDLETCIAVCEVNRADATLRQQTICLASAECTAIDACLD